MEESCEGASRVPTVLLVRAPIWATGLGSPNALVEALKACSCREAVEADGVA